jgi:[ribosomal protein S5]-alanine N-acetyltransferase
MTTPVLTTARMKLRHFTPHDATLLKDLLGDEDVMRYSVIGRLSDERIEKHVAAWIQHYDDHGYGIWAVEYEAKVIGFCGVDWKTVDGVEQVQLSYRFSKHYWGKGLAYEAASRVCEYAYNELGIKRIICLIDPENEKSIALAFRLGMEFSHETMYLGYIRNIYAQDSARWNLLKQGQK